MIVTTIEDSSASGRMDVTMVYSQYQKSVTLDVKSCAEAHVHLYEYQAEPQVYEIVIGAESNMKTVLYRGTNTEQTVASESTPDVLHCLESRAFWISWDAGQIDVGKGSMSGKRLLSWMDDDPQDVHTATLSSGPGSEGAEWVYPVSSGNSQEKTQNICITVIQCRTSVEDVGPTLYKCYANVLCLLGSQQTRDVESMLG